MEFNFEQAKSKGSVNNTLRTHYVEMNHEQKKIVNKLLESFNYSDESTEILNSIIELVAFTNYRLGADRQKKAMIENMKIKVEELEYTYINKG